MESYPPSKRPRLDRGDFIENLEANQTHTYIDITPHENLQYGTSMYQHYDVHEPQFINNGTSNHDLLVPPKPTTSTMPSFDLMPMPDYLPSDEEYSFAHNNLYSTNLNQLMPNSHPVAGEHYYPSNHTNHNIPAYGYPNSSLPAHIQSAPSPNAPQIYVSQQHVATPTTIVDSAQIHINHPPPTPTVPAPVPSPIQSQPLLNESPSPSNSGSPGGSRSVSSPDHGPQLQRKSEVASSEEDLGFKLFCENPLVLVNYQSPYIRKQMNITLTKLFLCESDFDEHEGTITLWKFRDNTVMLGNPALFPQVPPVVLEPSMVIHSDIVSRVFSDDKCLYTVSGGDSLWLNWWNLSTFQETRLNITPKLGPLNIELPVTVTAGHVDKDFIYIATMRGHILILDKAHKKINKVLKLKSLSFAHSLTSGEKYLYAAYTDASVRLWYKTRNWRKKKHICVDKTNKTPVRGIELDEAKSYFAFSRLLQVSNKINKQLLEYGTVRFDQDVQCITSDKDFLYIAFIGRIEIRAKQSLELVKSLQLQNQNAIRWIKTDEKYLYVDSHPLVVYNKETLTPITIMGEASLDKNSGVRYTLCNHKVIIGGCKNGNVMIWRRDANVLIADLPPIRSSGETDTSQQAVTCMSMAGDLIYVGHYSGLVRIINRLSYQQDVVYVQQSSSDSAMQLGHVTSIFCDSEILVVGYSTGRVYSIAVADLMVGDTTNAMDNNARKSVLLTGGAPEDPTPILAPELLHQPPAHVVKISRSGPYLCLLSTNGHVLLYDIKSPSTPQKISTLSYGGFSANTSFYVDDEHVYVSAEETHAPSPNSQLMGGGPIKKSLVKIWNFHNLNEPFTLKTDHSEAIFSLFSDEYYLFTCTRRGELKIWSKTPTKHGRQLPANDFSDLGTSPENNDMSHMMNNWRVGSPPTNRDGNGRSIRANGLAAQGGLNPQSEQHTQSTDVNMNGDQSSNGVCDGPFGQVKTTQCNWREIECFSRMQFSMITGETFLPAFSLGDHKYINPIEFQSRAQIEVNSQTQSLVNNDNDSTIVVSRMLNKDGRLPQEFIPKGSVFSQEETPGFVVTPNIIFKNS